MNHNPFMPREQRTAILTFDKVLVRDDGTQEWCANYFSHYMVYDKYYPYACIDSYYRYCIPYEGNEHLLGTTDNGIMLKSDEYVEVMEDTHNADGKGKDNLYQRLGRYLYSLVKGTMDEENTTNVQVELNITKIK